MYKVVHGKEYTIEYCYNIWRIITPYGEYTLETNSPYGCMVSLSHSCQCCKERIAFIKNAKPTKRMMLDMFSVISKMRSKDDIIRFLSKK